LARPLRITYEGAFYHVTARGNDRKKVFLFHSDYERFLATLTENLTKYKVNLHAYALMGNHYHLLIETPLGNISSFMQSLNTAYTTYFNRKRNRIGHLFQGRYKALLIEADSYLLQLSRYIHLNPVTVKMVEKPDDYVYSSYKAYIDPGQQTFVTRSLILSMVAPQGIDPHLRYADFVLSSDNSSPFEKVYGGLILGQTQFIKSIINDISEQTIMKTETAGKRSLQATATIDEINQILAAYFKIDQAVVATATPHKHYAVYLARRHTALSNVEIGKYFSGISCSAVTKICSRLRQSMEKNKDLKALIENLENRLSLVNG
jgi:putative transposase